MGPLSTHSLQTLQLHSLQEPSAQIEKQLKIILTSLQTSNSNMKSYTHHIKQMHNRKQTFMSISFNINTQRTNTKIMNLNQPLSINPNICTWVFLHSSLHALALPSLDNLTIYNEGVYIPFPSCVLKQSNLELNFYLLALTTLNAFYLLRTRAKGSRSVYIIQVRLILMASFKITHQIPR
jgi:hypothetical protein